LNIDSYSSLEPRFQKAYDILLEKFGTTKFTFPEADGILKNYSNKKEVFSRLEKAGLLQVEKSSQDRRKKLYRLIPITAKRRMGRDELIKLLKSAADLIRTRVDYRVLLVFLFYKTISDKYSLTVSKLIKEGYSEEEACALANYKHIKLYDIERNKLYTWKAVVSESFHNELINGLYAIVELNPDSLKNLNRLIDKTGLPSLFSSENAHIVEKLINLFGEFDFSKVSFDALGDAYEWILYYFAPTKAKEGEVYTPIEVSRLIAEIVEPAPGECILDPACGSASMLIEQFLFVKKNMPEASLLLTGQEANDITAVLAELNFILHGIKDYQVFIGDSLLNPKFDRADKIVANPPWNQDGYNEDTLKRNPEHSRIFRFGYTAKKSADWAWLQLMMHYAEKKAAVVLDSGALFRGGKERNIRKLFVENDLIDTIILLPEKIFYNTQAPGVIIVINREKSERRRGKILFINASKEFIQHPEIRKLNKLSDENIERIARTYREYKEVPNFSRIVDVKEIEDRDFNLNVPLYVVPEEETEKINLIEEFKKLEELHGEYLGKYESVRRYLNEITKIVR